jgi:putative ABC transport system permease protein
MTLARFLRIARQRWRALRHGRDLDDELSRELALHFDALVAEYEHDGMTPAAAQRAARLALGNSAALADQCRDQRRVGWIVDFVHDVKHGVRLLRLRPAFTVVAAASLALGIGANAAVLSGVTAALVDDLPFPDGERLAFVRTISLDDPSRLANATVPELVAWQERNRAFEALGASLNDQRDLAAGENGAAAERLTGQLVSPEAFVALRVAPALGRTLTADDIKGEAPAAVAVISDRLWRRRFGGEATVIGRVVRLSRTPTTVVGVMPPSFRYPDERSDYWVPLRPPPAQMRGSARFYRIVGRLRVGVTPARAQADLERILADRGREVPGSDRRRGVRLQSMREAYYGWAVLPLGLLQTAVLVVLLIACANVAGLLLARGIARQPELAIRAALGAGRGRLVRQLFAESLLLAVCGGLPGVLVAYWGVRGLDMLTPPLGAPRIAPVAVDVRTMLLLAVLSIFTALLFGAAPAVSALRVNLTRTFKGDGPGLVARSASLRLRGVLVAAQIALAVVLLTGAGLLLMTFWRLSIRELNFSPEDVMTFEYRLPTSEYAVPVGSYRGFPYYEIRRAPSLTFERIYDLARQGPGVESVAGAAVVPFNALLVPAAPVVLDGEPRDAESRRPQMNYFFITPGFCATVRTPLLRGREFTADDRAGSRWVAIVNETAARVLWPGQDAIGKRLILDVAPDEQPREVVGVVRDALIRSTQTAPEPVVYVSYLQQPARYPGPWVSAFGQMTFLVRASSNPRETMRYIREAVARMDRDRAIGNVLPMEVYTRLSGRRNFALVIGAFAAIAVLLAAIGIYGVMAYAVALQAREVGVRIVLGAGRREILTLVGSRVLAVLGAGLAAGILCAVLASRFISSQLWETTTTDPATFGTVVAIVVIVGALACALPARRALRINPTVALKLD